MSICRIKSSCPRVCVVACSLSRFLPREREREAALKGDMMSGAGVEGPILDPLSALEAPSDGALIEDGERGGKGLEG